MLLTVVATATWFRSNRAVELVLESPGVSSESPATTAPPASPPVPPVAADTVEGARTDAAKNETTATTGLQRPVVVAVQLCRELSTRGSRDAPGEWRCVPPSLPVAPGALFFYTRLKSPADTTIQHRWYRGDRLRRAVNLRIRANTRDGYRTHSRSTVDSRSPGDWRVELRTKDGVVAPRGALRSSLTRQASGARRKIARSAALQGCSAAMAGLPFDGLRPPRASPRGKGLRYEGLPSMLQRGLQRFPIRCSGRPSGGPTPNRKTL